MSDQSEVLVRKAVRALTDAEREDLLVQVLLQRGPTPSSPASSSGAQAGGHGAPADDVERLAAVLGGPVDVGAPVTAMRVLPIRMPVSTHERLRGFCATNGFSMAVVIRALVERFLDQRAPAPLDADDTRTP